MFFQYIEKVRRQPVEARKRFAYVFSGLLTFAIVLLWLSVHLAGRGNPGTTISDSSAKQGAFDTISESFTQTVGSSIAPARPASSARTPDRGDVRFTNAFAEDFSTSVEPVADSVATTSSSTPPQEREQGFMEDILNEAGE